MAAQVAISYIVLLCEKWGKRRKHEWHNMPMGRVTSSSLPDVQSVDEIAVAYY